MFLGVRVDLSSDVRDGKYELGRHCLNSSRPRYAVTQLEPDRAES